MQTSSSHTDAPIRVERRDDGAVWITLDRPEARNALSRQVNLALAELAMELAEDSSVRVVLITGAGEQAFCAGADLKERRGVSAAESKPYVDAISRAINLFAALPVPTIGVINGYAFGGGMELALACDLRIAAEHAQFGLTEVRLGIMPGAGGTQRLTRLVGVARAKELILLGRRIDARRACEYGLIMDVVPGAELRARAQQLVDEILGCAPRSVAMAKAAIDRGSDVSMDEGLRIERACYDVTLFTEDRDEGLRAFAEKRSPRYKGR